MADVENVTTITAGLDATNYVSGTSRILEANAQIASSGDNVVGATSRTTKALLDGGAAYDRLRSQLDPAYSAAQRYAAIQATLAHSVEVGRATQEQANNLLDLAAAKYKIAAEGAEHFEISNRQADFALHSLTLAATGAFTALAAGEAVTSVLATEISRLTAEMLLSHRGFALVTENFGILVDKVGGGWAAAGIASFVALTVAAVALGVESEREAEKLTGLQNVIGATSENASVKAAQVVATTKLLAGSTALTSEAAEKAAASIAATAGFQGTNEQLASLVKTAEALGTQLGIEVPEAAKKFIAEAIEDPGKAVQDLVDKHLVGYSQSLADLVKRQQAAGESATAFATYMAAVKAATAGVTENITPLRKALNELSEAFSGSGQSGESFGSRLGITIAAIATNAIQGLKQIIDAFEYATEKFRNLVGIQGIPDKPGVVSGPDSAYQQKLLEAPGAQTSALSSAGAIGAFQLEPGTAKDLGVNPYIKTENVHGGLGYIQQLAQQFGGGNSFASQQQIAGAYNQGPTGFRNAQAAAQVVKVDDFGRQITTDPAPTDYQTKVASAKADTLPSDTANLIDQWGKVLQLTPALVDLAKRISVVENQGQQGPLTPASRSISPPSVLAAPGAAATATTGAIGTNDLGVRTPPDKTIDQATLAQTAQNSLFDRIQKTNDAISLQTRALALEQKQLSELPPDDAAGAKVLNDQIARTHLSLAQLAIDAKGNVSDQAKMAESARDAANALTGQSGAAAVLAKTTQSYVEAAKKDPNGLDVAAQAIGIAAAQKTLNSEFDASVAAITRSTVANENRVPALVQGGLAAAEAANHERALNDALKTADPATAAYANQVNILTAALNLNALSLIDVKAANDINGQQKQLDLLREEVAVRTESNVQAATDLAIFRQRQSFGLSPGEGAPTAEAQAAIAGAGALAQTQALDKEAVARTQVLRGLAENAGGLLNTAFDDAVFNGTKLSDVLTNLTKGLEEMIIQALIFKPLGEVLGNLAGGQPAFNGVGGIFAGLGGLGAGGGGIAADVADATFATGGVFPDPSGLSRYSNSIVDTPTQFRFASGAGLMGEAGPEAILPLTRGPGGELGVQGAGGSTTVHVNTPITVNAPANSQNGKPMDPAALRQLQSQVDQTVKSAVRSILTNERRPGGQLYR